MACSTNDMFADDFDSPTISRQSTCRRCRKHAKLVCMRCEDYYCSKKCQDLDWKSHRYICFPKPPLLESDAVSNDENVPDLADNDPIHLTEQLRSMINLCQDFLNRLEKNSKCKCNQRTINGGARTLENATPFILTREDFENSNIDNDNDTTLQKAKTSSKFNSNYKHLQKFQKTTKPNGNASFINTYDDTTTASTSKINIKSSRSDVKKKKLQESTLSLDDNTAVSIGLTENSTSDICSIASSKNGSESNDVDIVYLTSFRSANRVAVCPKSIEKDGFLCKVIDQIDKFGRNASKLTEMPDPESYVISLRANKYARAKIMPQKDNNPQRIRLEFVDYGNLAYRKLSDLREILPALADLPIYVSIVQLSKVDLINYDEHILRFFSTFEKKYYKMKKVPWANNKIAVELYDLETGDSMNEIIMQEFKKNENAEGSKAKTLKTKAHGKDIDSDEKINSNKHKKNENKENSSKLANRLTQKIDAEPVLNPPFKHHILSKNSRNFKAVILDTTMAEYGYFACILQSNLVHLSKIQSYLENLVKSDEPYLPVDNEYVIAKFEDDAWYRGKVVGVSANKTEFEISYIDYLNMATIPSKDIRRYPEDLTIDCYTTLCVLSDMPKKCSPELKDFLKTNFNLNDIIHIDRVADILDEDVAMIECHELMDRLRGT